MLFRGLQCVMGPLRRKEATEAEWSLSNRGEGGVPVRRESREPCGGEGALLSAALPNQKVSPSRSKAATGPEPAAGSSELSPTVVLSTQDSLVSKAHLLGRLDPHLRKMS